MRPGSKEEFITQKSAYKARSINDRRKQNIPVKTERRSKIERRNHWTIDNNTGISTFTCWFKKNDFLIDNSITSVYLSLLCLV